MLSQDIALSTLKLKTRYEKKLEQQFNLHGISLTEFLILRELDHAPDHTLRRVDLAQMVGLTASGVTRVLAPMEKIKLVAKQPNPRDARVSSIKLTEAGSETYQNALVGFEHVCQQVLEPLTTHQQQKLAGLLALLL